jgi:structural maintenance of chromosomes protein 6
LIVVKNDYQSQSQESTRHEQEHVQLQEESQLRQQEQVVLEQTRTRLTDDMTQIEQTIREQQSTIVCIEQEIKQKRQELIDWQKIEADKNNVYGTWMPSCLEAIEKDTRFHKKPIGPLGRHIHCIQPYWAYAVEKHLAPIMSSFICCDVHDQNILLEHFSCYSRGYRPTIYVMKYCHQVHNVSGTLERIQRANLTCVHQVLSVDNVTVECALIDFKQIEATLLVKDFAQAKRLKHSGVLRWERIENKVKHVVEAWTYDGSNIKMDKAFRIYTNDRQPARYFLVNHGQTLNCLKNELAHRIYR